MEFIDTHSHLYDTAFDQDVNAVIEHSKAAGISQILQPDIDSKERDKMFDLVAKHNDYLKAMLGLYPCSVEKDWEKEVELLNNYKDRDIVAIGEIGLDYHWSKEFKAEQKDALVYQLELASKWDLPVNIHLRDATGDFMDILRSLKHLNLRGNMHAFSGSYETFCQLQNYGDFYVAIGGVVTFKKASIAEDVKKIPLSRILLETDSPYLSPTPYRGKRNDSSNIPLIASKIAELQNIDIQKVAYTTTENAKTLFRLK